MERAGWRRAAFQTLRLFVPKGRGLRKVHATSPHADAVQNDAGLMGTWVVGGFAT